MQRQTLRRDMLLFFILITAAALGNGLSDSIYANYFNDVYHVTTAQRGFIEFPRELPGMLCALVIASMSAWGDLKASLVAQVLACAGLTALGVFTPSFGVMLLFLFVNSMGMHLFMPLQDSVGMALAEPGQVGRRMGQYASAKTAVGCVAGIIVFFGFRSGAFSFTTQIKTVFLLGAGAFLIAIVASLLLVRHIGPQPRSVKRFKLLFRKQYRYFYFLTILHGVQKQIAFVYGTWVVVRLLSKGADIMSLLLIASSFLGIFFMRWVGHWMDKFGIKRMMYLDALSFIVVYVLYGFLVWGITSKVLPGESWPVMVVYGLFVLDRLSMQIGIVKSIYLRSIAVNDEEITATLSTGISLDHVVAILAAQLSATVWDQWGPQWVFFFAAFLSLGNLFVAWRLPSGKKETCPEANLASDAVNAQSL